MSDMVAVDTLKRLLEDQQIKIENLEKKVVAAMKQAEAAEQYSRQDCLIFRGKVSVRPNKSLRDEVMRLIAFHTGVTFPEWCVNTVHWLGGGKGLIVRFNNKAVRDSVYYNRIPKDPAKRGLFVHECLTGTKMELVNRCAKLRRDGKILSYYTQGGSVFVRKTRETPNLLVTPDMRDEDILMKLSQQPNSYRAAAAARPRPAAVARPVQADDVTRAELSPTVIQPHQSDETQPGQLTAVAQPPRCGNVTQPDQSATMVQNAQSDVTRPDQSAAVVQPPQCDNVTQAAQLATATQTAQSAKDSAMIQLAQSDDATQSAKSDTVVQSAQTIEVAQSAEVAQSTQSGTVTQLAQPTDMTRKTQPNPMIQSGLSDDGTQTIQSDAVVQSAQPGDMVQPPESDPPAQSAQCAAVAQAEAQPVQPVPASKPGQRTGGAQGQRTKLETGTTTRSQAGKKDTNSDREATTPSPSKQKTSGKKRNRK